MSTKICAGNARSGAEIEPPALGLMVAPNSQRKAKTPTRTTRAGRMGCCGARIDKFNLTRAVAAFDRSGASRASGGRGVEAERIVEARPDCLKNHLHTNTKSSRH